MKTKSFTLWIIVGLSIFLLALNGCKDTDATHEAGNLEKCKILIDDQEWASAIDVCEEVATDEGYHLTAQAYMGRAGITLFTMLNALTGDNVDVSDLMFSYIPDTTADANDYRSALQYLLTNIETKNQTVYLESLILSGLLVFKELKTLLGLTVTNGNFATCAGEDPSQDVQNCSWGPSFPTDVTGDGSITFGGLGSDLYTNLCGANSHDASYDNLRDATYDIDPGPGVIIATLDYDTTVDSCSIKANSVLDYNKTAYANYTGELKTSLEALYYYEKFDSGQNFEVTSDSAPTVSFCHVNYITPPDVSDDKLNDCEMLYFLTNPSF